MGVAVRDTPRRVRLGRLAATFGLLGLTSFGGALSAHLWQMLVYRRRWVDEDQYLDGLQLAYVLPGSNSINLTVYLSWLFL